jgi:pimeloyl-ACP methyl ester carboxylesterase
MRARSSRSLLAFLALLALVATGCTTASAPNSPTVSLTGTPTRAGGLATTPCQFSPSAGVTCYTLTVPEDRAKPAGAKVQLAIAVIKSASGGANTPPVFFLQGGPGGNAIDFFASEVTQYNVSWGQVGSAIFGNRDVILLDQRGTGYSKPSLACSEINALQYQTDSNAPIAQQIQQQNAAISACQSRLTGNGITLNAYTSYTDANDVHDVIDALGYSSVDLYGVSYGTRLALEVMRSFPQRVRSVVLDSTVPAQLGLLTNLPYATARVFKTLWDGCAADAACNAKYPNLEQTFYDDYAALNANPITFQTRDQTYGDPKYQQNFTVLFNGDSLANLLFTAFYDVLAIPDLPKMLAQLKNGDSTLAASYFGQLMFDSSVNWGMYYSVECAEDVDLTTDAQLTKAAADFPAPIRQDQLASLEGELQGCQLWGVKAASASESQPVTSSIPTLILEGQYDPVTPPSNGDLVAQTLSKSYTFLFPGIGHGVMFSDATFCATKVTQAFWASPTSKPNASCLSGVPAPTFH